MLQNFWKKNCPKCGREQYYKNKYILNNSIKKNKVCLNCANKKDIPIEGFKRICKKCGVEQKYSCRRSYNFCKKQKSICKKCATKESAKYIDRSFQKTDEYRIKMSNSIKNSENHKNCMTEEIREKLRIAKLNQIRKMGTKYTYNINACKFIEEFGKKNGYNFRHAMNGGEVIICGYSLDGYDKEKNIIFEYDEPKHNVLSVQKNDRIREQRIIQKINPSKFIRYNEKYKKFYDIISGKEWL